MKAFLNTFMGKNRHLTRIPKSEIADTFISTIEVGHSAIGNRAFRLARALNAAVFDAVMVGVARRLKKGPITDKEMLKER